MTVWLICETDGCCKFANEDEAPPSTPFEKEVKRNNEKYKHKVWVRKIFQDYHSKGEFHLLVTFPRQIPQYIAWVPEKEYLFASIRLADTALYKILKVGVILLICQPFLSIFPLGPPKL